MLCGLNERDITPPLGVNIPGYFESRPAMGVRESLMAKGAAFKNEKGDAFILVAQDTIASDPQNTARTRARICEMTGVKPENIMVTATHTHTGGPVDAFVPGTIDWEYMNWMADRAADAGIMAWNNMRPVKTGFGRSCEDTIAFIRRYFMKDGTFKTNPGFRGDEIDSPAGEIDPEVGVLKIEDMNGKLVGVITNYACHLDVVTGNLYSPDYPGELSSILKKVYGQDVISIFLTGACGNINHFDFMHRDWPYYKDPARPHYKRMGKILAGDVIKTLENIEAAEADAITVENAAFPALIRTPSDEDIENAKALLEAEPYEVCVSVDGQVVSGNRKNIVERHYARSLLEVADIKEKQVSVPVQTARIGGMAIVGVPCELFVEFGLDIKKRSPFDLTMISTLTNENYGYIAVRDAFGQGGYETQISGDTMMAPDTGYDMADVAVTLLNKMK